MCTCKDVIQQIKVKLYQQSEPLALLPVGLLNGYTKSLPVHKQRRRKEVWQEAPPT